MRGNRSQLVYRAHIQRLEQLLRGCLSCATVGDRTPSSDARPRLHNCSLKQANCQRRGKQIANANPTSALTYKTAIRIGRGPSELTKQRHSMRVSSEGCDILPNKAQCLDNVSEEIGPAGRRKLRVFVGQLC